MPNLRQALLTPGNSARAVELLTQMLENCRQCQAEGCPGLGELLIQVTVESALEHCEDEVRRQEDLGGLLPGAAPAGGA